jgi:hypothetical protein
MTTRTESSTTPPPAAAGRALSAGTRLDDYEIEQVLAQSSLAVVYRAYDHALRLQVAIKEYMPDALAQRSGPAQVVLRTRLGAQRFESGLRAFIGEAQTLARFEHPSLLRVDRILQRNGSAYRVMRHSPGPTLLEHRRALGRSPSATTLRAWFDALLGALEVLHNEGWMHASVTPGNILLLQDGRPLLMDFGAVRAAVIDNGTQDMLAALEPSFEPIEQRDAKAGLTQGPWTDLYSLAATLRFCVSGQLPAAPGAEPARPPSNPPRDDWQGLRGDPSAPDNLVVALEACLADTPQDRPQSVAQVRALLDRPGAVASGTEPAPDGASAPSLAAAAPAADTAATSTVLAEAAPLAAPAPDAARDAAQDAMADDAADAARAKVIADLELTFARIDALAESASRPVPPPAAERSAEAAAAATAAAEMPQPQSELEPKPQRRRWPVGAAALLLAVLLGGAWLLRAGPDGGGGERPAESAPAVAVAPAAPTPVPAAEPAPASPAPVAPVAPSSLADTAPSAAPAATPASSAAPAPKATADAATKSKAKPAAIGSATAAPPGARTAAAATSGPRAQCGKRSGYALYQCMQTQCAKRSFTNHPECQRLRKEQRLP